MNTCWIKWFYIEDKSQVLKKGFRAYYVVMSEGESGCGCLPHMSGVI